MNKYLLYKCSDCNRKISFIKNSSHVIINNCNITLGCKGKLIFEKETLKNENDINDLDSTTKDWKPRNSIVESNVSLSTTSIEQKYVPLFNSIDGKLVLAIRQPSNIDSNIKVILEQLSSSQNDIASFQYKVVSSNTTIIQGKDLNNKVLQFNSLAITEKRVVVKKDGIILSSGFTLEPNKVIFNSSLPLNSKVIVSVYSKELTNDFEINFKSNLTSTFVSAWDNINYITSYSKGNNNSLQKDNPWWVYTVSNTTSELLSILNSNSNYRIKKIIGNNNINIPLTDVIFLFSHQPFENADRIFNLKLLASDISNDFVIKNIIENNISYLFINNTYIKEQTPFYSVNNSEVNSNGYKQVSSKDIIRNNIFNTVLDDESYKNLIINKKYIGPI